MNIRFLEAAVWLAKTRSFRLTADHLHITQAAISSRISTMEQEIGVKLFIRNPTGADLTPEGEKFVAMATDILAQYQLLLNEIHTKEASADLVRIGVVPSLSLVLLPDILLELRNTYPTIRLDIITATESMLSVLREQSKLDICLTTISSNHTSNYLSTSLCKLGMFWIAAPKLIPLSDDIYSLPDLTSFPIITYSIGTINGDRMITYLGEHASAITHTSNSLNTTIDLAQAGFGVAAVPPLVIQDALRSGALHVLRVSPEFPTTEFNMLSAGNRDNPNIERVTRVVHQTVKHLCRRFSPTLIRTG